jgi:hypothetical protein
MQVQRGSTGILSLAWFLDRGEWSTPPLAALPPAKKTVTPCIGGLVDLSTSWIHAENIPAPDCPACSEWLCQLSYPTPQFL